MKSAVTPSCEVAASEPLSANDSRPVCGMTVSRRRPKQEAADELPDKTCRSLKRQPMGMLKLATDGRGKPKRLTAKPRSSGCRKASRPGFGSARAV